VNLRPLGEYLVIEPQERATKTAAGLFLAAGSREKPQRGVVLAVGPGRMAAGGKRMTMEFQAGDVVLFTRQNGTEIRYDHRKLLILKSSEILAIFEA
jgi:chaperonin GroES